MRIFHKKSTQTKNTSLVSSDTDDVKWKVSENENLLGQNLIDLPFLLLYRHFVRRGPLAKYPGLQIWAHVAW